MDGWGEACQGRHCDDLQAPACLHAGLDALTRHLGPSPSCEASKMLSSSDWLNSLPPKPKTRTMTVALAAAGDAVPSLLQRYTRLEQAPLICSMLAAAAASCR